MTDEPEDDWDSMSVLLLQRKSRNGETAAQDEDAWSLSAVSDEVCDLK